MKHQDPQRLTIGDRCVLLLGTSLYDVEIVEVSVNLLDDPLEFAMYRVKSHELSRWFEEDSQHRSDLFRMPTERPLLIKRIEDDIDSLQGLLREQEREQEIEDEAAIPHDAHCGCEECCVSRADENREEPNR